MSSFPCYTAERERSRSRRCLPPPAGAQARLTDGKLCRDPEILLPPPPKLCNREAIRVALTASESSNPCRYKLSYMEVR